METKGWRDINDFCQRARNSCRLSLLGELTRPRLASHQAALDPTLWLGRCFLGIRFPSLLQVPLQPFPHRHWRGARRVRSKASGARTQVPDTLGPPPPKLRQARQGSIHSPFHSSTCSCDFGPTYDLDGLFLKKVVPPSRTLCQILPHSSPFSFFAALPPFSYCAATLATICFSPPAASPPPCEIAQSDLQSSLG